MKTLYVKDVTGWDLLASHCPACKKLQVHGFWNHLDKTYHKERRRVTVRYSCRDCKHEWTQVRRLTTGQRRRLFYWDRLLWAIPVKWIFAIPSWLRMFLLRWSIWLDAKVKL